VRAEDIPLIEPQAVWQGLSPFGDAAGGPRAADAAPWHRAVAYAARAKVTPFAGGKAPGLARLVPR